MAGETASSLRTFANIRPQTCWGQVEDEARMKPMSVVPLIMLLIIVLFVIFWLGGAFAR
jgi:hypothetical protein